jgi:serine/threonine protein kinase
LSWLRAKWPHHSPNNDACLVGRVGKLTLGLLHSGKHPSDFAEAKKLHPKLIPTPDGTLGGGSYGQVHKVVYRSVCLARKHIRPPHKQTLEMLREEARVMERLDHEHIVKLVGSYATRHRELYLLIWPVAICNLGELITDLDDLRTGQGDREDIVKRLKQLELDDFASLESGGRLGPVSGSAGSVKGGGTCPLFYLQRIMGCIAQAVTYCHNSNIRHLDLKPSNILINPNRVYLADFGIARDVHDQDKTTTIGRQGTPKWRAPEIYDLKDWSMKSADIYSLGLVFLNIATMIYHASLADFFCALEDPNPRCRAEKLAAHQTKSVGCALATQSFADEKASTLGPKHIIGLTTLMLANEPGSRPRAEMVARELALLGGIDQVYHNSCCRKPIRELTRFFDSKYASVFDERTKLQNENRRLCETVSKLTDLETTYEDRLENERKQHARNVNNLQRLLEEEKEKRRELETRVKELEKGPRRQNRPPLHRADRSAPSGAQGLGIRNEGLNMRTRQGSKTVPPVNNSTPVIVAASAKARPVQRVSSDSLPIWSKRISTSVSPSADPIQRVNDSPSPNPLTPTGSNYPLRSRGSGSRLPVAKNPATPIRSNTPIIPRDSSLTDSTQFSMSSSIFSRYSADGRGTATNAVPTPIIGSPEISKGIPQVSLANDMADVEYAKPTMPASPVQSYKAPSTVSVMSSPKATRAELASATGDDDRASVISAGSGLVPAKIPSLQSAKSWAAVAEEAHALKKMIVPIPPLPTAKSINGTGNRRNRPFSMYV